VSETDQRRGIPDWIRDRDRGTGTARVRRLLRKHGLNTVCAEALCPNRGHCYGRGTATFLIMGRTCTRSCMYCGIEKAPAVPAALDPGEPAALAEAAAELGLRYVVVTSVTRDDIPDGGASHFAATVRELRERIPGVRVELLVPDFSENRTSLETIASAGPDVFNHNLETVERLFPLLRPVASYGRSLEVLRLFGEIAQGIPRKSGIMLGLGESRQDLLGAFRDLRDAGTDILTLGQYLRPHRENYPVQRFLPPEEFEELRILALEAGFSSVASGPLVRSSYHAEQVSPPGD
jgi:lipoic acid synthetase